MSEQTPTSTEDLNGAEPSMEDILASIRKIISEDEPVAMGSPEDALPVPIVTAEPLSTFGDVPADLTSDAVLDTSIPETAELDAVESLSTLSSDKGDSVDLNIDDVLAGLDDDIEASEEFSLEDLAIPEIPADATEDFSVDNLMSELDMPDELPTDLSDDVLSDVVEAADDIPFDNDDDVIAFLDSGAAKAAGAAGLAGAVVAAGASALTGDTDALEEAPDISDLPDLSDLLETVGVSDDVVPITDSLLSEAGEGIEDLQVDDGEMDALLDGILSSSDETIADDITEDGLEDILDMESLDFVADEPATDADDLMDMISMEPEELSETEQSDLDLVKSLMAELSDNPSYEDGEALEAAADLDELADDTPDETVFEEIAAADAEDEDILGDILDMSLEDELHSQPDGLEFQTDVEVPDDIELANNLELADDLELNDLIAETDELGDLDLGDLASLDDVAAAEQENLIENLLDDAVADDDSSTDLPSLAEIAAAAQADAVAVETSASHAPTAAAAGLTVAGAGLAAFAANSGSETQPEVEAFVDEAHETADQAAESVETVETDNIETVAADAETPIETQSLSNQETSMPVKAVKTDTIIDEVTETATSGAFAELNQVVEDKAIFNERGPRIGDLVQDALRPMLKEWLDANLKGIVERAVTKEVKRISKGG